MMIKNEVKIIDSPISIYPNIAYPLMIILGEPHLKEWYYEHFINIYAQCWDEILFRVDFLDSSRYFGDVIECCAVPLSESKNLNITEYVVEAIDKGYCVNIFTIDEYYLSNSNCYNKEHFIHETLVYGYNKEEKVFNIVGYDKQDRFCRFEYKINEVEKAFKSGVENAPYYLVDSLHKIKIRHFFTDYEFSLNNFIVELEKYLFSLSDKKKKFFSLASEDETFYGEECYKMMIKHLENYIENKTDLDITYLCYHFFYEHKKMIIERLNFVDEKYKLGKDFAALICEYNDIVKRANNVRLFFIKESIIETREIMRVKNIKALSKIHTEISDIQDREEKILLSVYNYLKNAIKV
ncbi:hypothetical protein [Eubacterium sp.]|uniref:hypothetical protein n=1 Tax=Eubacterium sp. TaxID=142586 RepID=UPI0035202262